MSNHQQRYVRMSQTLRLSYGKATHTIDGKYVLLDGEPVGELGWKWWVYKVIDAIGYKNFKRFEENKDYEKLKLKVEKGEVRKK